MATLDLLSWSSNGGVQCGGGTVAGKGKPPALSTVPTVDSSGQVIESGQPLGEDRPHRPDTREPRVWVDDVNGDGKLDLLVGDSVTLVAPANGLGAGGVQQESLRPGRRHSRPRRPR